LILCWLRVAWRAGFRGDMLCKPGERMSASGAASRLKKRIRRLIRGGMWYMLCHMKTVTIRQVHHDFAAVLAMVAQGEEVTVLNRTRPVARICPPRPPEAPAKFKMPDFAARAKAMFGDRIIPNVILEEREESRW